MEQSKACGKCKQIKPFSGFSISRGNKDGLQRECKDCNRAYRKANAERRKEAHALWQRENKEQLHQTQKAWRDRNKDRVAQYNQKARAKNPDYFKTYYQENKDKRKAYSQANKYLLKAKRSAHYEANKESLLLKRVEWAKKNPHKQKQNDHARRIRKHNADKRVITKREMKQLLQSNCFYCDKPGGQIDHIIPLARGGRHAIGNLVSACAYCNQSKGAKTIMEFRLVKLAAQRKGI